MSTITSVKTLRDAPNGIKTNVTVFPGTVVEVLDTSGDWSKIKLEDQGSTEGWILTSALSNAPAANIDNFVDTCQTLAPFFGINTHFLVASAKLRSDIQLKGSAGSEIGPFRLLQSEFDANRQDKVFEMDENDFPSNLITDFRVQCQIFALMTSRAQDAIRIVLNGRRPSAVELYLTLLVGAKAADKLINEPATTINTALKDASAADLPAGGGTPPEIIQRYEDILGGATATGKEAIERISDAFMQACNQTRDAILNAESDVLDEGDVTVHPETDPESVLFSRPLSSDEEAPLKGHLILKLQDKLIKSGHLPAADLAGVSNQDGFFGPDTEKALKAYQHDNGFPISGMVTHAVWRALVGEPSPDIYDLCAQLTASFEGTNFGGVNETNFDNTVITFGYHGYTLTGGNFQLFLQRVDQKHAGLLDTAFGPASAALLRGLFPPVKPAVAASIGKSLFLANPSLGKKSPIKKEWRAAFATFGNIPEVRDEQIAFSREIYWADAKKMRELLGLSDPLSNALCFDVSIQNGLKTKIAEDVAAEFKQTLSEREKRERFAEAIVSNSSFKEDVRQRKVDTLVDGTGRVHGADYSLNSWGFGVPDEAGEKEQPGSSPASQSSNGTFAAFLFKQIPGYSAFAPNEFFVKGGAHQSNGLNTDPPHELWPNVIPLARLLADFKARLGNPSITFNSVYRSRRYNESIGGARNSQHMHFDAADIVVHNSLGPRDWAQVLRSMRGSGVFKGGIGTYRSFVHVDTRGFNADWTG